MNLTVSRIALVKPDKARGVEDVLLRAAQTGGISEKVIAKHKFLRPFVYSLVL
jgi:DNA-binding TFAR19-related protein (PDSD5 family)